MRSCAPAGSGRARLAATCGSQRPGTGGSPTLSRSATGRGSGRIRSRRPGVPAARRRPGSAARAGRPAGAAGRAPARSSRASLTSSSERTSRLWPAGRPARPRRLRGPAGSRRPATGPAPGWTAAAPVVRTRPEVLQPLQRPVDDRLRHPPHLAQAALALEQPGDREPVPWASRRPGTAPATRPATARAQQTAAACSQGYDGMVLMNARPVVTRPWSATSLIVTSNSGNAREAG